MLVESVRLFGRQRDHYLCSGELIISDGPMRFCLRGLRLIDLGTNKPHLAMPAWKKEGMDGPVFEDMFFPMTAPAREFLEAEVLSHFYAARR